MEHILKHHIEFEVCYLLNTHSFILPQHLSGLLAHDEVHVRIHPFLFAFPEKKRKHRHVARVALWNGWGWLNLVFFRLSLFWAGARHWQINLIKTLNLFSYFIFALYAFYISSVHIRHFSEFLGCLESWGVKLKTRTMFDLYVLWVKCGSLLLVMLACWPDWLPSILCGKN